MTELQVELERLEAVMLSRFNALLVRKKQAVRALHRQLEVAKQEVAIAHDETAAAKLEAGRVAVAALREDVAAAVSRMRCQCKRGTATVGCHLSVYPVCGQAPASAR